MTAEEINKKISSISTDFEMGYDVAVIAGLQDLEKMFSQFCTELTDGISEIQNLIMEVRKVGA